MPACLGNLNSQIRVSLTLNPVVCADVAGVQAGVWYMRDRKPVRVAAFAQLHNLFMTLLSLWMTVETVTQVWILPICAVLHMCLKHLRKHFTLRDTHVSQGLAAQALIS